jgi:hypothetical protein
LKEQQSELIANDANRSSNYSQQANEDERHAAFSALDY